VCVCVCVCVCQHESWHSCKGIVCVCGNMRAGAAVALMCLRWLYECCLSARLFGTAVAGLSQCTFSINAVDLRNRWQRTHSRSLIKLSHSHAQSLIHSHP